MSTPVEQIKSRLNIVDVVGGYVRLQKAGSAYKGLCPFHSEKTPSFTVSPTRQSFHCFGCNKGGDIFTFIEEIDGLDFPGALKVLAEKAGVELRKEDRRATSERERWYSVMETATRFYLSRLKPGSAPYTYLTSRGLTPETIATFRIGFAPGEPEGWHALSEALGERGIKDVELERVGLSKKSEKGYYDRFRSRIMFPIMDSSGRVIAFSGRIFLPAQAGGEAKDDVAKYINSPETPLYDKSTALFGFDQAKTAIRKQNFAVIVEGQMDLILAHQAGTGNTVAVSGTALTERHLSLLKRLTPNIVFAFDGDAAGLSATTRAFSLALSLDMQVRAAALPKGVDPADLILSDKAKWEKLILESKHIIEFLLDAVLNEEGETLEKRRAVEEKVLPYVAQIRSSIEQAHFVLEIARKIGVPDSAVWESLSRAKLKVDFGGIPKPEGGLKPALTPLLLRLHDEILGIILWQGKEEKTEVNLDNVKKEFTRISGESPGMEIGEAEENQLIVRVEQTYDPEKLTDKLLDDLLTRYEIAIIEGKQAECHRLLMRGEQEKNEGEIKKQMEQFQIYAKALQTLKGKGGGQL